MADDIHMLNVGVNETLTQNVVYAMPPYAVIRMCHNVAGASFDLSNDVAFGVFLTVVNSQNDVARQFIRSTAGDAIIHMVNAG